MLPRKLIIEYISSVKNAISVRYPPRFHMSEEYENTLLAIDNVKLYGEKALSLLKDIEELKKEKNLISDQFKNSSKDEKIFLKQKVSDIKGKLEVLEKQYSTVEDQCKKYESLIPNLPDPDVPFSWQGESAKSIKASLLFCNALIEGFNNHDSQFPIFNWKCINCNLESNISDDCVPPFYHCKDHPMIRIYSKHELLMNRYFKYVEENLK